MTRRKRVRNYGEHSDSIVVVIVAFAAGLFGGRS